VDLRAAARIQLGALGDPADLIAGGTMKIQGATVGSAAPFLFASRPGLDPASRRLNNGFSYG
jgi:hypothetical protein